jgi:hypothetical protein
MSGDYFPDLYDWLKGIGKYHNLGADYGYSVIAHFLKHYDIPVALDPAKLCVEAPATSSTVDAVRESLGRAEQEIIEAVDEGRPGFAGGWVSSIALERLLHDLKITIPRAKRRDVMKSLGYDWHPSLDQGRVNNPVMPDNGKPRLFIRAGHLSTQLREPVAVAKAYTAAQQEVTTSAAVLAFG